MSNRLFYFLGGFCVLSVVASVMLSHQIMAIYEGSVHANQEWADRTARYATMGQLVTAANGPGNEVFETADPDAEQAKLERLELEIGRLYGAITEDLARVPSEERQRLSPHLTRNEAEVAQMIAEAKVIFRLFREGDRTAAGARMAEMDRRLGAASMHLDALAKEVQAIQAAQFKQQLGSAAEYRQAAQGLVLMVCFLVVGVIAYGRRISAAFARSRAAIDRRNTDMARLLDNVDQGFVTVDRAGRMSPEHSRALARYLGVPEPGQTLWDYAGRYDPLFGEWLALSWEAVGEDYLPLEVTLDQLPKRLVRDRRTFEFEYRPILDGGRFSEALVVVSDVTERVERERAEADQKEVVALFERIIKDRAGVLEFFAESADLVEAIVSGQLPMPVTSRLIHTLKGNSGFFGLTRLTEACHHLEGQIGELGTLEPRATAALKDEWARINVTLGHLVGARKNKRLELEASDYEAALEAVLEGRPREEIARLMASWRLEPTSARLQRIAEQTKALANRLGKGEVTVHVEPNKLRTPQERWAPFWSALVHVVRNAVDHGLETPKERTALSKTGPGTITLRTLERDDRVVVEVSDDGRGVDWEALGRAAAARGMKVESETDLVEALFADGISTKDEVSDISGRGVGMAAVRHVCQSLGGSIEVTTERGRGTTFRFAIPREPPASPLSTRDILVGGLGATPGAPSLSN